MYDFFKNLTLVDTGRQKPPKQTTPEGGKILRIFANGNVYPSKELAEFANLEYRDNSDTEQGNGIDIVDTKKWSILAAYPRAILFGITPKTESKIDLFASCRYNEDGTPKSSVFTQGTKSEELLNLVKEFGWLTENQTYVDLVIQVENVFKTTDGISYIPKVISRGENKGEETYIRRENVSYYPIVPTDLEEIIKTRATEVITEEPVTN